MATLNNRRITAILLQNNLNQVYAGVLPLYAQAAFWNVTGIDDDLPPEGEVKTVLDGYDELKIPRNSAEVALRDVKASTEAFTGLFTLPSTAFLVPFVFSGPVWSPLSLSQGFGVALTIQRLTVFIQKSGTTGDDLSLDLKLDDVSILSAPISIAVGAGENVGVVVPAANILTSAVPASGVLSVHIVTAPDDAEGAAVNAWVKS